MNSSNKKIISIVLVLVLLLGVGLFFKTKSDSNKGSNGKSQDMAKNETAMSGSILDLMKTGNTVKCTFSNTTDKTKMEGTTYVSGKKLRSDTKITMDGGKEIESHMVSDGVWMYTWSSAIPNGFKMKMDSLEKPNTAGGLSTETAKAAKEFQNKLDFKCSNWSLENAKFDIPANVEFTDFSETVKKLENGGAAMCSACDYTPDAEAKAKCKAQFNCK